MLLITEKSTDDVRNGIEAISEIETVELTYVSGGDAQELQPPPPPAPAPKPVSTHTPAPVQASPIQQPAARPEAPVYHAPAVSAPPPTATPVAVPEFHAPAAMKQSQVQFDERPTQPVGNEEENDEDEVKEVIELVQLVTFTMAGETYALEIQQVEAIINLKPITRVPKAPSHIDGVINLRGEIVPVINTRTRLRLPPAEKKPSNQIIILAFEEEKVKAGFLVDSVQEVIRLQESAIEAPSRVSDGVDVEYLRGVGKIDNKIIIMLNAHKIVFGKKSED